jgi:hypothetical protein
MTHFVGCLTVTLSLSYVALSRDKSALAVILCRTLKRRRRFIALLVGYYAGCFVAFSLRDAAALLIAMLVALSLALSLAASLLALSVGLSPLLERRRRSVFA